MHIAVNNEDEPMIKLLFRLAAEEDPGLPKQLINTPRSREDDTSLTSSDRNTPLHVAAKNVMRAFTSIWWLTEPIPTQSIPTDRRPAK